ncbi:MAG: YbbR-like domain-containing protein [Lachnospiraceae bacterium]
MKERLTRNIGLKLLSLVMAFLLWVVVINSQDPLDTAKFEDIPVTILNEGALAAKDKIPEVVEGDTITVVVEARRSIIDKLTEEDIVATADFEKVSVTDAVPIEVSVKGYTEREVEIVRGFNQVMKLRLEDMATRDFRVKIATTGTPAEGYVVGDMVSSPNMITVTGSKTQISKIKEVVLSVDVEGISTEMRTTADLFVYDMNGDEIGSSKISLSADTASVTIPVLKTRTVGIRVYTAGTEEEGYEVTSVSYQPETILIAGTEEDLQKLGYLLNAYCDITGKTGTVEENIDLSTLWDSSLHSLRLVEEETLAVTIQVTEYEEKELELPKEEIELRGIPEGMEVSIDSVSSSVLRLKGKKARLTLTTIARLAPYIDVSSCTEAGVYTLLLETTEIGGLNIVNEVYVTVQVTEQETGEPLSAGEVNE